MNKKTQMWLGVAAIAVAGYLVFKKSKKNFANVAGLEFNECRRNRDCPPNRPICGGITSGSNTGRCMRQMGNTPNF